MAKKNRGGAAMRLRALVFKEFRQIRRDPSSIGIAFVMPVALLLLFGYGVSLDAKRVPVALVVEYPSADTTDFTSGFYGTDYFRPVPMRTMREARRALREHRVDGIVRLRNDFSRRLREGGPASIQVVVNGVDANKARLVTGYTQGVWQLWLARREREAGREIAFPVSVEQRTWFNSELSSRNFLVPGLVVVIMTLIGALLTAMVMAREWERGTMESLLVTPIRMREILLGKLIPYFVLGTGGMLLSVAMAVWLFKVPLRGSFLVLFAASSLFMVTALGMGLAISSVARNQFVAGQAAILATFLPAFLLSGFLFDIRSMPLPIQALTHVVAARYFVAILHTVFLAGDIWPVIWPNALALAALAAVFFAVTIKKTRKSLE